MSDPSDLPSQDPSSPSGREWAAPDWYPDVLTPMEATKARRSAGMLAVTIAVVALLMAGVGSAVALSGQQANTPQDAVHGLLSAAGNADVLGILDRLDPPERDALAGFFTNGTADLTRLGILAPGVDLHHLAGVNADFTGLLTTTTELRPGLAAVKITGGTVHTRVEPALLPLGSFVHDVAASALGKAKVSDRTQPLRSNTAIVTVRRGNTWYVSIGYTIADAARVAAKAAPPKASDAIPAVGADSAKGAVDAFVHAVAALDVRRLVELTPPDEMGALHDYAGLFVPGVNAAVAKMRSGPDPVTITITDLSLSSAPHAGGELVKVARLGLRASYKGSTIALAPGARCLTVAGAPGPEMPGTCGSAGARQSLPPSLTGPLASLTNLRPEVGIVTVRRGGKWYVSPTRTILDDTEAVLRVLTPEILQSLKAAFNPASLFGLAGVVPTTASGFARPGATIIGSNRSGVPARAPRVTPCVNGTRTITFPPVQGIPARPPVTLPC
ncbi:MAG: hypothetical protein NVS3B12_09350 [Acidimicrobiales bacterium]